MGNRRNKYIGGLSSVLLTGPWGLYSTFTTARDLPDDAGWIAIMLADPPVYAPWLLFALSVGFLAWVFWKRDDEPPRNEEASRVASFATTSGAHSSAVAGPFNGPVTINHGTPAEPQKPEKEPYSYDLSTLAALERVMNGKEAPRPDFPLSRLLSRVYKKLGPSPTDQTRKSAFRRRVNLEVADNVKLNDLWVWGRIGDKAIERITARAWGIGEFDHNKGTFRVPNGMGEWTTYSDLKFNGEQIDNVWPE